jgi:DNA ligase 1
VQFKPLLAAEADVGSLRYPLMASPKLDGVRAIVINGVVMSRSLKPIPNKCVQRLFGHLTHLDGELIVGSPTSPSCYRDTMSGVMTVDGDPDVWFYAFDHIGMPHTAFATRYNWITVEDFPTRVIPVWHHTITDEVQLISYEGNMLLAGYEGIMLRDPKGPYKFGRSTAREGILLKLKRFADMEAVVIGYEERMHNANAATINALGNTERSSHQENLIGRGDLGALHVRGINGPYKGVTFSVGTGFTDGERARLWAYRKNLIGTIRKIKYFPLGSKDAPRFPVDLGPRSEIDV